MHNIFDKNRSTCPLEALFICNDVQFLLYDLFCTGLFALFYFALDYMSLAVAGRLLPLPCPLPPLEPLPPLPPLEPLPSVLPLSLPDPPSLPPLPPLPATPAPSSAPAASAGTRPSTAEAGGKLVAFGLPAAWVDSVLDVPKVSFASCIFLTTASRSRAVLSTLFSSCKSLLLASWPGFALPFRQSL
jgi:hypothetical protein